MADPNAETGDDTGVEPGRASLPGMPRWVKVFAIIVVVLIVLVVGVMFIIGGDHGPGMHSPGMYAPGGDPGDNPQTFDGAPALAVAVDMQAFDPVRTELTRDEPVDVALTSAGISHDPSVDRDETDIGALVFAGPGS